MDRAASAHHNECFEMMDDHALYHDGCVPPPAGAPMKSDHHAGFVPISIILVDVLPRKDNRD
jgi:hypothetical protein